MNKIPPKVKERPRTFRKFFFHFRGFATQGGKIPSPILHIKGLGQSLNLVECNIFSVDLLSGRCPGDKIQNNLIKEECICPDISTEDPIGSDQCKCPGDLVLMNRLCECPNGSEKDNNDPTLCNEGTLHTNCVLF